MENVKKRRSVKVPARAGIWSIISALVARGVGVVGTPIFTRLLTPAEYGLYPHYTTWLAVAVSVLSTALSGSVIYRGLQKYRGDEEKFINATVGFGLFCAFLVLALAFPFASLISGLTGLDGILLLFLLGEAAFGGVIAVRSAALRYEYKYRSLAITNLLCAIGVPVISVAFLRLTPFRAEARILGSFITTAAVAIPTLVSTSKSGRIYDAGVWRYLLKVGIPLVPHCLASSLILRASEMVIGRTHGAAALAKYSVGISVGLALTFISNALTQVTAPWMMRKIAKGDFETVRELTMLVLRILLASTAILLSVAPEILAVMTPPEYKDALATVYPLSIAVSAMFISNLTVSAEGYYERSVGSTLPTLLTAAASVSAAILFIPRADYRFSAVFTLASYLLLAALSTSMLRRISWESIIIPRECLVLFAFSSLIATLMYLFREVLISRILLALPALPYLITLAARAWHMIGERKGQADKNAESAP